jgi:hypothetical protein
MLNKFDYTEISTDPSSILCAHGCRRRGGGEKMEEDTKPATDGGEQVTMEQQQILHL